MGSSALDVQPVVLEGAHVRLEPLTLDHARALTKAGADDDIWTWMPLQPRSHDDFARWIGDALRDRDEGHAMPFAIIERATNEPAGSTRYMQISPPNRRLEIGWTWLAPHVRRTAVNTECKYLLLRHAFETLGCLRVELKTDARNTRSRNAILRIGALEEGTFRKHQLTQHGVQRDTVYFSIIDDEWPAVKQRLEGMLAR